MQDLITFYIEFARQLSLPGVIFISAALFFYLIRFFYDLFFYGRVAFSKEPKNNPSNPGFSVLMAARNEEDDIRDKLPQLLASKYDNFEVVVVDDFSQDQTYTLLGLLREKNTNLRISSLNQETKYSSKQAMNIAFKAAKNDWVIISRPSMAQVPEGWFESFAEKTGDGKNLVVGYTNINARKSFYNKLFRIESFYQQFQSFAYIKAGCGFVMDEDNLCMLKEKYFEIGGFGGEMNEEHANVELLANKFLTKKQTALNLSPNSIIRKDRTINALKLGGLFQKSIRIIHKLGFKKQLVLLIDDFTRMIISPLTVVLFILFYKVFIIPAILVLLKLILHIIIVSKAQKRLNERKIFLSSLLYELVIPYYKLFVRWDFYRSSGKRRWNN